MALRLFKAEVEDRYIRENFVMLEALLNVSPLLKGNWRFFEYTFTAAATLTLPHALKFKPIDVIMVSVTDVDSANVTWQYDDFTGTNLVVTSDAACHVRAFIGRYKD